MSKDMLIVGSDDVEVTIPNQLAACSLVLRRRSILGPITMPYTGEELSNAIAAYMERSSTGKYQQMSPKETEILEEMGLGDVPAEQQQQHQHIYRTTDKEPSTRQRHSLGSCPYHHQIQEITSCDADSANSMADVINLPMITLEEFIVNNGSDGHRLWILIDTIVFDVTEYLNKHPGGRVPLLNGPGKDSTLPFYQHHGRKGNTRPLFNRLKCLAVGRMSSSDFQRVPGYQQTNTEECGNPSLRRQFLQYFHVME